MIFEDRSREEFARPVGTSALGRSLTKEWREGPLRSPSHFLKWREGANDDWGWRSQLTGLWYSLGRKALLKVKKTRYKPSRTRRWSTVHWLSSMTPDYQAAHAAKRNTAYERARSNLPLTEVQTSA